MIPFCDLGTHARQKAEGKLQKPHVVNPIIGTCVL
jgi:hypothetical protein